MSLTSRYLSRFLPKKIRASVIKSQVFSSISERSKNVVIVDGVRLPFSLSSTIYENEMAVDLQRLAFKGLIDKTAIDKNHIDYVIAGNVIQEVRTSNIAREAAINAGLPNVIGGHTIAMVSFPSVSRLNYPNS